MSKLTVYFVQIGTDGYLPETTIACSTLAQAIEAARAEKWFTLDHSMDSGDKVRGNIRRDWCYEVYNPDCISEYRYSIRIDDQLLDDCDIAYYPDPDNLKTRAGLEKFCDWYNQNN